MSLLPTLQSLVRGWLRGHWRLNMQFGTLQMQPGMSTALQGGVSSSTPSTGAVWPVPRLSAMGHPREHVWGIQ